MLQTLPDTGGTWRRVVDESPSSGLAHSPEWFTLIHRAYGHTPLYLTMNDGNGRSGVLPAFVVRRPFFGTVVTSMPFLDSGGPCSRSADTRKMLVEHLIAEARRIGAARVELRCAERLDIPAQPAEHKVNLTLPLPADPDQLWRRFDKQVRNQVRKAERCGLTVEHGGVENLRAFYEAFVVRMRDLGSPPHAPEFLRAVLDAFGGRARIVLVRKGNLTIGALFALAFKDRLVVPWAICLKEYFSLCPNMLLYWETLRSACVEGFTRFDFGRSTRDSGTYRFKVQWGAQEEPLFWYFISPDRIRSDITAVAGHGSKTEILGKAWQRLPLALTRCVGPHIRRYLTQ
jgi:FemAB-related protein (PEP-CTERM system-associated)